VNDGTLAWRTRQGR